MKRKGLASVIVAFAMSISMATIPEFAAAEATEVMWGDINGDNKVSAEDAMLILRKFTDGMTGIPVDYYGNWSLADVNSDGTIDVADAQQVLTKFVEEMIGNSYYFTVESPLIIGRNLYATESWNVYDLPDNAHENFLGVIKAKSFFKIKQYMGDCWYMMENENFSTAYINIKSEDWRKRFYYEGEEPEIAVETTTTAITTTVDFAETTTTAETTTEPTVEETTTTVETTTEPAVAETTTTEATTTEPTVAETTTTAATTTEPTVAETTTTVETTTTETITPEATVTEPETPKEPEDFNVFEIGEKVKFKAVAWTLFSNDIHEVPIRWMKNGEVFIVVDRVVYDDHAKYCITFDGEDENTKYILTTKGQKLYFERIT